MTVQKTGGQIVCESLLREGVEVIFGLPGGAILPLYQTLPEYPGLRHILTRQREAPELERRCSHRGAQHHVEVGEEARDAAAGCVDRADRARVVRRARRAQLHHCPGTGFNVVLS